MSYLEQTEKAGREILPDLVRAFALIGIALVNVGVMAYPMMMGYLDGGLKTPADTGAYMAVNSLFLMKSYTLFSFMFGVGFAYQIASAARKNAGFGARYTRRIIGLLVLGLLHVALLFQGDILVMYAILGTILYLFRNLKPRTLVKAGIGIYAVQVLVIGFMAFAVTMGVKYQPEEMAKEVAKMTEGAAHAHAVFGNGTFVQSIGLRFVEWSQVITFGMLFQGIGALAFFLFGLAAVKSDIISNPSAEIWGRFRRVFLPIGLIGSAFAAWLILSSEGMMDPTMMAGMALIALFSPFSTAGYLGLIAKWAARPKTDGFASKLRTFLARGGTATLTAYLMQGLLFSLIFNNYGLGNFAKHGALVCVLIAFGVAVATLTFASLWRTKFERGPMESLLRRWTYLGPN
jgi:uncharacterized protein